MENNNYDDLINYLDERSKVELHKLKSTSNCITAGIINGIEKAMDIIKQEKSTDIKYLQEKIINMYIMYKPNAMYNLSQKAGIREVHKWLIMYDLEKRKINEKSNEYIMAMKKFI